MSDSDEEWTLVSMRPSTSRQLVNEETQTETQAADDDSDVDVLERFVLGEEAMDTESLISDFSILRSAASCVSEDFRDDGIDREIDLSPGQFKAYTHIPNKDVNSQLNIILALTLTAVAGLAIGNYWEWSEWAEHVPAGSPDIAIHQQLLKLKQLQEELVSCKEHQVDGMNSTCLVARPIVTRCGPSSSPSLPKVTLPAMRTSAIIPVQTQIQAMKQANQIHLDIHEMHLKLKQNDQKILMTPKSPLDIPAENRPQMTKLSKEEDKQMMFKSNSILNESQNIPRQKIISPMRGQKRQQTKPEAVNPLPREIIIETRRFFPLDSKSTLRRSENNGITVWLLLSGHGISRPLFTSGLRRLQQVSKSHVNPFLEHHFKGRHFTIWPEETGISLLKSDHSVSENIARGCEIERVAEEGASDRFWAKVSKQVYRKGRRFESKFELEQTITDVLMSIRDEFLQHLWFGFNRKISKLRERKLKYR